MSEVFRYCYCAAPQFACKGCGALQVAEPRAEESPKPEKKIHRNMSTPESRAFWESVEKSAAGVSSWPSWKKAGINIEGPHSRGINCVFCNAAQPMTQTGGYWCCTETAACAARLTARRAKWVNAHEWPPGAFTALDAEEVRADTAEHRVSQLEKVANSAMSLVKQLWGYDWAEDDRMSGISWLSLRDALLAAGKGKDNE